MSFLRSIVLAELLLLVPLIGTIISDAVQWDVYDFLIAAVLLAGIGMAFNLVASSYKKNTKLVVIGIGFAALIVLLFIELAVGIFGTPLAGS